MPISGTISPATGAQSTPTPSAAREAFIAAKAAAAATEGGAASGTAVPGVEGTPRGRGAPPVGAAPAPGAAAPVLGPDGKPVAAPPGEPPQEAWRVEAIARREREATQARLAAKAERDALARDRVTMEAREKSLTEREARLTEVDKRLGAYRYNPHLALQDLASYGVSFEMLAQAVAQGMATPDQLAAAEAAAARREVAEFRTEQTQRDADERARRERETKERETSRQKREREQKELDAKNQAAAEDQAVKEWHAELRAIVTRDVASYPVVAARIDRGALDLAFRWGEEFLAKENRVPTNEEVLAGVEEQLQAEARELSEAMGRAPHRAAPAGTLSNALRPAPAGGPPPGPATEQERRTRTLKQIDRAFGRG